MASNNAVHPSPTPKEEEEEEVLDLGSEDEDAAKERQLEITPYEKPTTFKPVCHEVDEEGKTVEDSVDLPPVPNENDHHPLLDEKNRKAVDLDLGWPKWAVFAQFMKYGAEGCQRGLPFIMLLTEQHRPLRTMRAHARVYYVRFAVAVAVAVQKIDPQRAKSEARRLRGSRSTCWRANWSSALTRLVDVLSNKTRGFPCLTTTVTYDGRCAAGAYQQHDAGRGRV